VEDSAAGCLLIGLFSCDFLILFLRMTIFLVASSDDFSMEAALARRVAPGAGADNLRLMGGRGGLCGDGAGEGVGVTAGETFLGESAGEDAGEGE